MPSTSGCTSSSCTASSDRRRRAALLLLLLAATPGARSDEAPAQLEPGSVSMQWSPGAKDCAARKPGAPDTPPPLQVHRYNDDTYILREELCATFEAPFMYLLLGSERALLIDTGDVSDPVRMPLAETLLKLLPGDGAAKLPLLVVHTHRHLDHRAGDPQTTLLRRVELVAPDLASVQRFFGFQHWPDEVRELSLGDRTLDVIPTPGHSETHISFYDRKTGLFFSGDFLLPGRLLIDDIDAERASAARVAEFVRERPVSYVLGGHIEMNRAGNTYPWESTYHPDEHALALEKAQLLALPEALRHFNGFYSRWGGFIMMNSTRCMLAEAAAILLSLIAVGWGVRRYLRQRRAARRAATAAGVT